MSLQRAAAQSPPPVAFQLPAPVAPQSAGAGKAPTTKVVRIYRGPGFFDDALAEKLLPMLVKAFPSARPDPAQPGPGAPVTAPAKIDGQKKVAATHL